MCGGRTSGMPISEWNCRSVCIKSSLSSVTCSCVARAGGYKPMLSSNAASASISEAIAAFVRSELPASPILPSSDVGTRSEPTPPTSVPGPHTDSPIRSSLPCTSTLSRHERLSHSYTSQHSLAENTHVPTSPTLRTCRLSMFCTDPLSHTSTTHQIAKSRNPKNLSFACVCLRACYRNGTLDGNI